MEMIPNTMIFGKNKNFFELIPFANSYLYLPKEKSCSWNFQLFYLNNGTHGIWFSLFLLYNSLYFSKNETFTSILYFFFIFFFIWFYFSFSFFLYYFYFYICIFFFFFYFTKLKVRKTDSKINRIIMF